MGRLGGAKRVLCTVHWMKFGYPSESHMGRVKRCVELPVVLTGKNEDFVVFKHYRNRFYFNLDLIFVLGVFHCWEREEATISF